MSGATLQQTTSWCVTTLVAKHCEAVLRPRANGSDGTPPLARFCESYYTENTIIAGRFSPVSWTEETLHGARPRDQTGGTSTSRDFDQHLAQFARAWCAPMHEQLMAESAAGTGLPPQYVCVWEGGQLVLLHPSPPAQGFTTLLNSKRSATPTLRVSSSVPFSPAASGPSPMRSTLTARRTVPTARVRGRMRKGCGERSSSLSFQRSVRGPTGESGAARQDRTMTDRHLLSRQVVTTVVDAPRGDDVRGEPAPHRDGRPGPHHLAGVAWVSWEVGAGVASDSEANTHWLPTTSAAPYPPPLTASSTTCSLPARSSPPPRRRTLTQRLANPLANSLTSGHAA